MATGIVEALYPYSYEAGDGRTIAFSVGERFSLLNKTNTDWWQVQRGTEKPMYVPAGYMTEISENGENVIYQNVNNGEAGVALNLSAEIGEENGRSSMDSLDSKEEGSESFDGSENSADQGPESEERNSQDLASFSNDSSEVKSAPSAVKSLARSLDLSGVCLRGGSFSLPASARTDRPKSQSLPVGWTLFTDKDSGRPYYFNAKTNETRWKPPRGSRARTPSPNSELCQTAPLGWRISTASLTDEPVYINEYTEEEWLASKDETGRVYYYQVNGEATAWELPEVEPATRQSFEALDVTYRRRSPNLSLRNSKCQSMLPSSPRTSQTNLAVNLTSTAYGFSVPPFHERSGSVQSRDSLSSGGDEFSWPEPPTPTMTSAVNFFQEVEKQGPLNRKKVAEGGGKKIKKMNWTPSFIILFSSNMVFYKDQKAAAQKPGLPHGKPESSCVLQGASLEWAPTSSTKKKNAFQIRTVSGLVFLLQHDHQMEASNWFNAIACVIKRLNEEENSITGTVQYQPPQGQNSGASYDSDDALDEPGTPNTLTPGGSLTGMRPKRSGSERDDSKNRIKDRLKRYLMKRPAIEELEKKGILKESVFGCNIVKLCEKEKGQVPLFVTRCIAAIENRGLSFDGMYRVCGNVSTVQKIRIMIDQEENITLGEPPFDDVHALTGTLKLYFRELPEPLIPFDFFSGFVEAIKQTTRKDKLTAMRSLATQMPKVNGETLRCLLRHLRKLMEQSDENRMTAQNIAIVWGPNLMWPRHDAGNVAINVVHQNQIIEFLLLEFENMFSK